MADLVEGLKEDKFIGFKTLMAEGELHNGFHSDLHGYKRLYCTGIGLSTMEVNVQGESFSIRSVCSRLQNPLEVLMR